jgi:hypothetical protein
MTSQDGGRSGPAEAIAWQGLLAAGILVGAFLRWYQLGIQVVLDDEWHALHKVLYSDAVGIATSFGYADHSIPLALYYRFLLLHGGLTEWVMHLPMLVSGIALLVVMPLLLRRETTLPVRSTWVALLAISPLLVYHSKVARPYALTSLLVPLAILAFRRWWLGNQGPRVWSAIYVVAAFLAGWLHTITLAFTLLPFIYYGMRCLLRARSDGRLAGAGAGLGRLFRLGLLTAIPLAAALLPPLIEDWGSLSAKAGVDSITLDSAYRSLLMLFGISQPLLLVALVALTALGIHRMWRRDADLTAYLGTVMLGAAVAIAAARPVWIQHPALYSRYLLPVLPFLLLFLAEGMIAAVERLRSVVSLRVVAIVAMVAALWWLGPIPGYVYYPNQFMGHLRFQFDYDPAHNPYVQLVPPDPVPEFYRTLAQKPPASLTLIEAPWRLESNFNPHPWYQEIHRQKVKIGLTTPVCGVRTFGEYPATVAGLRLHQFAHLSNILAGKTYGADYLVMHLAPWKTPPDATVEWPNVAACLPTIEASLGSPVYRDAQIVVFALKKP